MNKNGWIEIVCGPMFSGKTEELLRKLNRLNYAKKDFLLFKPVIDDRFDAKKVVSHSKNSMFAINIENSLEILAICEKNPHIKYVGIDEIQFLPAGDVFNALKLCIELKKRGYTVFASGLDMDFQGNPFGIMGSILSVADCVEKLKACCFVCGEDAPMSAKIDVDSEEIIDVGGTEKYQAMCYLHWLENIKSQQNK